MASRVRVFDRILAVVRKIPRGKVATYGGVAGLAGLPRGARVVAYALREAGDASPWHRVVGRGGKERAKITIRDGVTAGLQRAKLEREGVKFDARDAIALDRYGWGAMPEATTAATTEATTKTTKRPAARRRTPARSQRPQRRQPRSRPRRIRSASARPAARSRPSRR